METNYRTKEDIKADIARRQKKLFPLNIVVAVLALVAALTIMFAPSVTIDLGKSGDLVTEIIQDSTDDVSQSDELDTDEIISNVMEVLDFKISLTTCTMLQFSLSDEPVEFISAKVAQIMSEVTDSLLSEVLVTIIVETVSENTDLEITTEEAEGVLSKIEALETAASSDEVDETIEDIFAELQSIFGVEVLSDESYEEFYDTVREIYDNTVEYTEDGTFSVEAFVSVYVSESLGSEEDDDVVYTSYEELVSGLLNSILEDMDDVVNYSVIGVTALAIAMTFFALMWLILFLFSLIRIFTKNKRFTMWYVKLFGFFPCLLFGVIPLALPSLIGSFLGESVTIVSSIFGMISSLTWISGACYILLWLISIFWAFPIKRKIRADIKEMRAIQYY